MRHQTAFVSAFVLLYGCALAVGPGGIDPQADAASAWDAVDWSPSSAACTAPPTGMPPVTTLAQFRGQVAGRWVLCSTDAVFGHRAAGEVGLEITADGHWYRLIASDGGPAMRGAGWELEGTWTALHVGSGDDPQPFQLNLETHGGGTVITRPAFALAPRAMRLDNEGYFIGDYVAAP